MLYNRNRLAFVRGYGWSSSSVSAFSLAFRSTNTFRSRCRVFRGERRVGMDRDLIYPYVGKKGYILRFMEPRISQTSNTNIHPSQPVLFFLVFFLRIGIHTPLFCTHHETVLHTNVRRDRRRVGVGLDRNGLVVAILPFLLRILARPSDGIYRPSSQRHRVWHPQLDRRVRASFSGRRSREPFRRHSQVHRRHLEYPNEERRIYVEIYRRGDQNAPSRHVSEHHGHSHHESGRPEHDGSRPETRQFVHVRRRTYVHRGSHRPGLNSRVPSSFAFRPTNAFRSRRCVFRGGRRGVWKTNRLYPWLR